jgi:hypothetical protein
LERRIAYSADKLRSQLRSGLRGDALRLVGCASPHHGVVDNLRGQCGTLEVPMNPSHPQPKINLSEAEEYREIYSNSVQVRVSVWDFLLIFGLVHQDSPEQVNVQNSLGVYLSPQQAKALWNILGQNLAQYEQTFGTLALEPQPPKGPVH